MTSKTEQRKYEEWLSGVKSKLPTEKQELLTKLFDSEDTREVGLDLYRGYLGQTEISQRMSEIDRARKEFEAEQRKFGEEKIAVQKWFNDELPKNERLTREYTRLANERDYLARKLREYGVDETDLPAVSPVTAGGVSGEDLDKLQKQVNQFGFLLNTALPQVMKRSLSVTTRAIKEGWNVDGGEIFDHALRSGVTPEQAFDDLTREEREERESKKLKDIYEKAKEEGRREVLARGSSPDHVSAPGPNALDVLRDITGVKTDHRSRVDAALSAFDKLAPDTDPMMPARA